MDFVCRESNDLLASVTVYSGEEVEYAYIHSADKTPVEQIFVVGEGGLLNLLEERYAWYGSGLAFGSGLDFDFTGEMVRVTGYELSLAELPLRVARTVPQEFRVRDESIVLQELAPGGTSILVRLSVKE